MKKILALAAGLTLAAVVAAANLYPGFFALIGAEVDVSTDAPVIAQAGQTISAQKGGANSGQWVATGTTTGAGTLTFADAAPNARACQFVNETLASRTLSQTNATDGKTVVTVAGTITSGDQFSYNCMAF